MGYWFAEQPAGWEPPGGLLDFLEAGKPPVLITLGSFSLGEEEAAAPARLFGEAIQQAGVRAIIQGWERALEGSNLPASIFPAKALPHTWLMPRCAAIVHHGGYGTTAAGLRAGIPALVIPHVADQFYWGQQVHELGVGLKPIRRTGLEPKGLAAALEELVRDEKLRANAARLGEQIRGEQGIENAIRLIEEMFA